MTKSEQKIFDCIATIVEHNNRRIENSRHSLQNLKSDQYGFGYHEGKIDALETACGELQFLVEYVKSVIPNTEFPRNSYERATGEISENP